MNKIQIHQPKIKDCDDSFFYDGLIAEKGKYKMYATGEIRIYRQKDGEIIGQHNGWKGYDNFQLEIKTDKDLERIRNNFDDEYYWDMNNWFEIIEDDTHIGEVKHSYDEALDWLEKC